MISFFDPGLEKKPDFIDCMKRIYAWYEQEIIDRAPVRFTAHNAEFDTVEDNLKWPNIKARWYDVEYQVEKCIKTIEENSYLGETFPLFWPNLGPNVFAGMLGTYLEFGDVTSWAQPRKIESIQDIDLDIKNEYFLKINELTDVALERCEGKYLVGYTDMHPGFDCADALLGTEELFYLVMDDPSEVKRIIEDSLKSFFTVMDMFHKKLKEKNQLSVSWMQIPSYETMHIPSCDLSTMMSSSMFVEFALPSIEREVKHFKHNIFHVDGKGVARHLDLLLEIPEIQGYQWVQGVGDDRPIMQWIPLIKRIQAANKSVVVDLHLSELDEFIEEVRPRGILLCIDESDPEIQKRVVSTLNKWR